MVAWEFVENHLRTLAAATFVLKLINLAGGLLLALSAYLQGTGAETGSSEGPLFWVGLVAFAVTTVLLFAIEQSPADQLKALHASEIRVAELEDDFEGSEAAREIFSSWLSLTKLLQELVDQALVAERISEEEKCDLFRVAVEFIAAYKLRLFGMSDDYMNISVYEYIERENLLKCIACFRSRPSDAVGEHRSWTPGSGHVGKAFEMKRELICGDATHPDVAAWIAAPPDNFKDDDVELYVSLASIPMSVRATKPLGVLIMTSDQPNRFKNGADDDPDGGLSPKLAVDALQDVASQLAQLLHLAQTKHHRPEA
ncbi:GAF domain-containing protein [Tabrizicola sp. BL-A-41-H6]|uniref:GAF domain-containing protein n=1 Tax=Tabrizicola sp. BL-A-41-H6 TaxID=3421107 RepID=UPI003D6741EB